MSEELVSDRTAHDGIVSIDRLVKRYGDLVAVNGLTLQVRRGEMFGIIGPDGAGKTTTLRVVLGLLAADGGAVLTCGIDPARRHREITERVGYLSQRFSLYGDLSVGENIAFFADVHGVRGWKPRRDELLEMLRLAPFGGRLADRLSGGMKQKLALACTLIHTPELLVLDEPTTGVDPVSRRDFWRILVDLQRKGQSILLTTPYLDEAERCGRVALMDHGRLLALDAPDALRRLQRGTTVEVIATPRRETAARLRERPEVTDVQTFGERLHVTLGEVPPEKAGPAVDAIAEALKRGGVSVEAIRPIPASLEDVFITRVREVPSAPAGGEVPA
jgi:ABC-2 type transport system ATP-binding protein